MRDGLLWNTTSAEFPSIGRPIDFSTTEGNGNSEWRKSVGTLPTKANRGHMLFWYKIRGGTQDHLRNFPVLPNSSNVRQSQGGVLWSSRLRGCLGWLQIPHEVQVLVPAIPLWPNSLLTHPRRQAMIQALGPLLLKWGTQVEFQYPGLAWSSHCDYLGSKPVNRRSLSFLSSFFKSMKIKIPHMHMSLYLKCHDN